ncbi:MAG: DnaJ like chaperone protein [Saprospiraceae bacterium]|jgi:DnaJ like chaperone protein
MSRYLKYAFALAGYAFGGFFGALIGYFIGNIAGSVQIIGLGGPRMSAEQRGRQTQAFVETLFTLMGALAKSDERVTEQEIKQAEQYMLDLGLTGERRGQAIVYFKNGSSDDFNIDNTLSAFLEACQGSAKLKHLVLVYLIGIAIADGVIHSSEDALLRNIASSLGYASPSYEMLLKMVLAQSQFSQNQAGGGSRYQDQRYQQTGARPTSQQELAAAYQALGAKNTDSNSVVKKAYRKLISEFHPDKLIGQGLPEDMIKVATQRTQEIQTAYQIIQDSRKS